MDDFNDDYQNSNISLLINCDSSLRTSNYTIYLCNDGKELIENIEPWTFNNPLDEKHVKSIKEQLIETPALMGVFTIIKLSNNQLYLLDGHHRHQALKLLFEENLVEEPIEIEVHCYETDTIDSPSTMNLFKKLNNTKPFSVDIRIQVLTLRIIDFMEKNYNNAIRDNTKKTYPFIRKKELNDALQSRIRHTQNFDYDDIIKNIARENGEYQSRGREIYRNSNTRQTWETVKRKVKQTECYLGLGDVRTWVNRVIRII